MADKPFNEQPLIVVVSNALDPRIKRQLSAQLQATTLSLGEVESEIENLKAMDNVIAQKEAAQDSSEFDENADKEPEPKAVEDESKEAPPEEDQPADDKPEDDGENEDDVFGTKDDKGDKGDDKPEPESKPEDGGEAAGGEAKGGDDPFGVEGDDNSDNLNLESFQALTGIKFPTMKLESAEAPEHPPIKNLVVITGTDQGVDSKATSIVATIEDPANTIVVVDVSAVAEVGAKVEFASLVKQLQSRGILALPSLDEAVEFLNKAYDELSA